MKRATIGLGLAFVLAIAPLSPADEPVAGPPLMKEHKLLAREEGVWDAEVTTTPPGATEPMKSKAVETNTLLGGRWLLSDVQMEFGGLPFKGHAQYGWDAKKGKFVGTWLDIMSTKIDTLEGTYDEATDTLTFESEMVDPRTGKMFTSRYVHKFLKDGGRVLTELLKLDGSKDYVKFMEITYKKRGK